MKRVLIANPYGIGDCLFTTPLIKALKESGVEEIDLLLGSRTKAVFKNNPYVGRLYPLNKGKLAKMPALKRARYYLRFYRELASNRYDTFIDLSLTREYAFFAKCFMRIPKRIGFNYKGRGAFLNHREDLPEGFANKKVAEYYTSLLKFTGVPVPRKIETEFFISQEAREKIGALISQGLSHQVFYFSPLHVRGEGESQAPQFICVSAGGGESWGKEAHFKRWAPIHFRDLLLKIRERYPFDAVCFIGSSRDRELNLEISKHLPMPFAHYEGILSLEETAGLMTLADFVLVNEGGLYHLASSVKAPVICLVGPVDERVYGAVGNNLEVLVKKPRLECRPCYKRFRYRADCPDRRCLENLTPQEAFEQVLKTGFLEKLSKGHASSR